MWNIFRRKRKERPSFMSGVLRKLWTAIEARQRQAADFLNSRSEQLGQKKVLFGLGIICIMMGAWSVFVIWQAFHQPPATVKVSPIKVPQHGIVDEKTSIDRQVLSPAEVRNILAFRNYLDSLQKTSSGQLVYDSLHENRRGLLDSFKAVQKLFSEQLKISDNE